MQELNGESPFVLPERLLGTRLDRPVLLVAQTGQGIRQRRRGWRIGGLGQAARALDNLLVQRDRSGRLERWTQRKVGWLVCGQVGVLLALEYCGVPFGPLIARGARGNDEWDRHGESENDEATTRHGIREWLRIPRPDGCACA